MAKYCGQPLGDESSPWSTISKKMRTVISKEYKDLNSINNLNELGRGTQASHEIIASVGTLISAW